MTRARSRFTTDGRVFMWCTNKTEGQRAWQLADHERVYCQVCFVWLNFVIMTSQTISCKHQKPERQSRYSMSETMYGSEIVVNLLLQIGECQKLDGRKNAHHLDRTPEFLNTFRKKEQTHKTVVVRLSVTTPNRRSHWPWNRVATVPVQPLRSRPTRSISRSIFGSRLWEDGIP
jgi:hypothetical protein